MYSVCMDASVQNLYSWQCTEVFFLNFIMDVFTVNSG